MSQSPQCLDNDEVTVRVETNGQLVAKTSQVLDYQQRAIALNDICLWDAVAQLEKVRKNKKKTYEDVQSVLDNSPEGDGATQEDDSEHINVGVTAETLLSSVSRVRPKMNFLSQHPDCLTHTVQINCSQNRFIPVPIGPSIPRRDREESKERYS
jgi:hypothetical protein